ncbi:MFS transporter [Thermomonas sp.]|uniref:MFS transporter n=1 Tax=Thermomonas sp. TaxID=1971895 RepID=UPI00257DE445|nr:MFS transporter [Thermomonas sp.]
MLAPEAQPHHRRAAAFGFSAALVSSIGQTFYIGLFGVSVQTDLRLEASQWGALYALATLSSGFLMFWLGGLADRLAMRQAITVALSVLGLGALLMAIASGPALLLTGLFCLRLGGQGLTGHMAIVAATRHARRRGRSIATAAFGFIVGEALLPISVIAMLGWLDWRWAWVCAALLVLGVALPALRMIAAPLPAVVTGTGLQEEPLRLRRRHLVRKPAFLAALAVVLVSPFVVTAVFLHQGTLSMLHGWTAAQIAWGFLAFAMTQAASTWLVGHWIDRHGVRPVFRVYLLPVAIAALALGFGPSHLALWILFIGLGATAGGNSVVSGALWAEVFGVDSLGMVRGVYTGFMVIATAVSPLMFGLSLEADTSVAYLAAGVAAYVVVVPWLAARGLART